MISMLLIVIGIIYLPPDPNYDCLLVVRPIGIFCSPGGNFAPEKEYGWVGSCNRSDQECPNP